MATLAQHYGLYDLCEVELSLALLAAESFLGSQVSNGVVGVYWNPSTLSFVRALPSDLYGHHRFKAHIHLEKREHRQAKRATEGIHILIADAEKFPGEKLLEKVYSQFDRLVAH